MKRLTSLFLSLLLLTSSLSARAQMTFRKNGSVYEFSYKNGPWTPLISTAGSTTATGPQGPAGATPTISMSVTTGVPGSLATVTKVGSGLAVTFNVVVPRGDPGAPGATGPAGTSANVTASSVRAMLSSGDGLLYDQANGQFYLSAQAVNLIAKNYLKSRDGYASGKVLSTDGNELNWVTPTSTTVTGGGSTTTSPGGTVVSTDHIFADSTVNRPNFALMVDVPLSTTAQIQSFLTTPQTNKRGIIAPGAYQLVGGSYFTQTGSWDNVALTAPSGATFVATGGTTCLVVTDPHTAKRFGFYGITFSSTSTGNGYPLLFSNELPTIQGWEIARCVFVGNNAGNWNAFNITAYSTSSNSGATSSDFYLHDNIFRNIPRCGVEILSQGYDAVRLTGLVITGNRFINTAANANEENRMATTLSGLITGIYHARNQSTNAKNMAYEFVNVKYAKAESNTAVASLEPCVGYSVSDDGRNSTEQIYLEGSYFNVTSRPFQLYDCKDVHIKGGLYIAGRGIDVNCRASSIESITATCTNLLNAEAIFQFGGTSNGNVLKNSTLSSWGSAAAGHEPSFETVVIRVNTYNNVVGPGMLLKQGKRPGGGYFTDGQVVNQGQYTPVNMSTGITVQLEP